MKLKKCPRCELNYVKGDDELCRVCQQKQKRDDESKRERVEMCPTCGTRVALKGKELCAVCLKEQQKMSDYTPIEADEEPVVELDEGEMDGMQIIDEMDLDNNAPEEIKKELIDDEDDSLENE